MVDLFSFQAFFQWCCLALFVWLLSPAFVAEHFTLIRATLAKENERTAALRNEYDYSVHAHKESIVFTYQQNEYGKALVEKMKQWSALEKAKEQRTQREERQAQERIRNYLQEQAAWLSCVRAGQEVMPIALEHARKDLLATFQEEKVRAAYLKTALQKLRGESHD